jgi:hypothetical protein
MALDAFLRDVEKTARSTISSSTLNCQFSSKPDRGARVVSIAEGTAIHQVVQIGH